MDAKWVFRWVVIGMLAVAGSGCVGYYVQSVRGQLDIMMRSESIPKLIRDGSIPTATRVRLESASRIRRFASDELGLPENGAYTKFADLGRPYAVWVVFATPELSLQPLQWCFPVAGCVSYRGYFAHDAAQAFAAELSLEGHDVSVSGVPAYSTLGWFDDPLLSTVLHYSEEDLAGLIFHELAHQVAYVRDDTVFNESFATTVERIGVRRWLATLGDPAREHRYEVRKYRKARVIRLIELYRSRLQLLYAGHQPVAWKRMRKRQLLDDLKMQYAALVKGWPDYHEFSAWFGNPVNNAQLISVSTYYGLVPEFERLFQRLDGDLPKFYRAVSELGGMPAAERDNALNGNWPHDQPGRVERSACPQIPGHDTFQGRRGKSEPDPIRPVAHTVHKQRTIVVQAEGLTRNPLHNHPLQM